MWQCRELILQSVGGKMEEHREGITMGGRGRGTDGVCVCVCVWLQQTCCEQLMLGVLLMASHNWSFGRQYCKALCTGERGCGAVMHYPQ